MKISRILTKWYSVHKRNLPWRNTKDPYHIWLSEILLQQTRIGQGLPYYIKFKENFPTVFDLAAASEQHVLNLWQGLGYYSRARNLHKTAQYISSELNGMFPQNYAGLLKLKGVGDYTASAIASFCFNETAAVVDGNVYRVLARYYGIDTPINSREGELLFKELATEILDKRDPATHNQAIMEFGALQCKPKNPDCLGCPLKDSCMALNKGQVDLLPLKLKKAKIKKRYFNYLVIQPKSGWVTLQKRVDKGIWQNMFEFPLVETPTALSFEELSILPQFIEYVPSKDYTYYLYNEKELVHKLSHQHLHTKFWIINLPEATTDAVKLVDAVDLKVLDDYPTPRLIENFVNEFNFDQ